MLRHLLHLLLAIPSFGIPAATTLTLVEGDPAFNRLTVTVDPGLGLSDTDTTTLTGTVSAGFDVDPATGRTSELTLSDGRASATDMSFSRSVFGQGYSVAIRDFSAAIATPNPPGTVDPASGEFDASQHALTIDQGSATGQSVILGNVTPIDFTITPEAPVEGAGAGTGQVVLTPSGSSGDFLLYQVEVLLPADFDETFTDTSGSITLGATGTLKAVGTLEVPASEYLAWTIAEGIPGAGGQADANGDGVPNAIAWAMGLGAIEQAAWTLPRPVVNSPPGFEIPFPSSGTAAPVFIEVSSSPGSWNLLPAGRCSLGVNPIPAGHGGTVQVSPSGEPREFLRLRVDE